MHADDSGEVEARMRRQDNQAAIDEELIGVLRADLQAERVKNANLEVALTTARRIGIAIGVLMSERKIPADEAFDLLSAHSQARNRKLRDVADSVIETGTLT